MEDFLWLKYLAPVLFAEVFLVAAIVSYFSRREDARRRKETNITKITAPLFGTTFGLGALWKREGGNVGGDGNDDENDKSTIYPSLGADGGRNDDDRQDEGYGKTVDYYVSSRLTSFEQVYAAYG